MSEWCHNRLEITGKSVCIDVMLQWINGTDVPRHRHAVQQSIKLFLAGAAGILKPVRTTSYPPCQGLVRAGTGLSTAANQAFESWLILLLKDAVLDAETIRAIDRLYHQSGLGALKWENIPDPAREVMAELIARQYTDWFGLVSAGDESDAATAWERLSQYPERSQPCDMLAVIPTRLAAELNGAGGLMCGVSTTTSLYCRQYGMEWPAGHNVNWQRHTLNSLTLQMNTPWLPPSGEVVGEISAVFDCEVRHSYSEPVSGLSGYDCYDGGEHVDGHKGASGAPQPGQVLYLVSDEPALPAQEAVSYREVRG
ncbi:DUF1281 domain-containing protein [Pectobacterium cacticida]|uniref:DUF1281 domain-containing protein n=1 Tax=Pectobacterium cacticida TaxID=69221 RepID=UPI002FEFB39F